MDQIDIAPHEDAARRFKDLGQLSEWDKAAERGRKMAEAHLKVDPAQRKMVESIYGIAYCRQRYPEAYK